MRTRVAEVGTPGYRLLVEHGFLAAISPPPTQVVTRVPLDDLAAVIADGPGLSISSNLLCELAERAVPLIVCGATHRPVALVLPLVGNQRQSERIRAQISASESARRRLWMQLVRAKITAQAEALDQLGRASAPLRRLVRSVGPGDAENVEAVAAKYYWPLLLGSDFRRGDSDDPRNSFLNYGYAVVRSCVARHLVAAGLHPSLPIHHQNAENPLALVDDLIEPFRPMVDRMAVRLTDQNTKQLTSHDKKELVSVLTQPMQFAGRRVTLTSAIEALCDSLVDSFANRRPRLRIASMC